MGDFDWDGQRIIQILIILFVFFAGFVRMLFGALMKAGKKGAAARHAAQAEGPRRAPGGVRRGHRRVGFEQPLPFTRILALGSAVGQL